MEDYIIRKIEKIDYNSFLILINNFRETMFTEDQFKSTLDELNKNSELWVIDYKKEIIGCATILYEKKFIHNISLVAHIEDVCIKSNYRGKNLGLNLIKHLVEEAKNKGCYKIILDCSEDNVEFYNKCSFKQTGKQMSIYFI
jgi:N-acetylglutamate synthase-like GNAT family acetyltransferase